MSKHTISRRQVLFFSASAAGLAVIRVAAHDGHDHEAVSPSASPEADYHMSSGTGTGAVYLEIRNRGSAQDRLVSAFSDASVTAEIHTMKVVDGVMSMMELEDGLEIPSGETVILDSSDLHVMLIDLNQDLAPGLIFDVKLQFENAGEVTLPITVAVEAPTDDVPIVVGDLELAHAWARPAPRLSPVATPEG